MSATEDLLKRTVEVAEIREVTTDGAVIEKRVETVVEVHDMNDSRTKEEMNSEDIQEIRSGENHNIRLEDVRDSPHCITTVIEVHTVTCEAAGEANNNQIQGTMVDSRNEGYRSCKNESGDLLECSEAPEVHSDRSRTAEVKENRADSSSCGNTQTEEVVLEVHKVLEVAIPEESENRICNLSNESNSEVPNGSENFAKVLTVSGTESVVKEKTDVSAEPNSATHEDITEIADDDKNDSVVINSISINAAPEPLDKDKIEGSSTPLQDAQEEAKKAESPSEPATEQLQSDSAAVKYLQNCQVSVVVSAASEHSTDSHASISEKESTPESTAHSSTKNSDVGEIPPAAVSQHQVDDIKVQESCHIVQSTVTAPPPKPPHPSSNDGLSLGSVTIRTTTASAPPTPPVRRKSTMPSETPQPSPTFRRPPSVASSRMNTMNYTLQRGRLSFPTLPRNARPPTREDFGQKRKPRSMFSWLGGDSSKKKNKDVLDSVSEGLRKIYKQKLYPLEEHYKFHEFHSPALDDPDFDAKPMILLVGQYSTGKTTFIRYLLEQDFPGIRIGPEPTTDRFIAVMHGEEEGVVPGNALVVDAKKQFRALSGFGNAFLNRFQCSTLNNQVLESVTIVDTPGILSGEKQRIDRGYDFTGVLEWFAERVDRIILLFDAHKLDISDEFKRCIEALSGNEDKIRIVLNKSDMVDHQQLMRVYGALMWSLGKVFKTPEVSRVYIGTFWDHPLHYDINRRLFQDEQHDLFQDLQALPRNAALRKLNDLIKRARLAKVHAFIISELRKQMPSMIGKEKKKKELIQNLDKIFEQLQREHNISPGDFPDVNKMRDKLQNHDFTRFNPLKPKLLEIVDGMLASDIARLMAQIPKEEAQLSTAATTNGHVSEQPTVKGGAFTQAQEAETPFGFGRGEGFDKGADEPEWVVSRERSQADATFASLGPVDGYISGRAAKEHMVKSKLPNAVLGKIWKLADVDRDGQLDADEFALANYLINLKLEGHELPTELPKHLIPPSKRDMEPVYPKLDDE